MAALSEFEPILNSLSAGEKAQLLTWLVKDLGADFPGIDARPDVCDGAPCIVRTRIPVWLLEKTRRLGADDMELLEAYPSLRAEDLVNAWNYVRAHVREIDAQIGEYELG